MNINLGKIFKQAWDITKSNRFLWGYGLFLLWGNLLNLFVSFQENQMDQDKFYSSNPVLWLQSNPTASYAIFFVVVLFFAMLIYLYFRFRAGSILAIKELLDKKPTSFKESFKLGRKHYRKIIYSYVLSNLALGIISLLVLFPIIYLGPQISSWQLSILYILGFCIWIPCAVLASLISILAPLYAVIFGLSAPDSVRASFSMVTLHWRQLILFGILLFCLMVALFVISMLILSPFVVLGVLSYHNVSGSLNYVIEAALVILGLGIFLFIQSLATIFQQSSWILVFLELVKPEKTEEESVAIVPEVAS